MDWEYIKRNGYSAWQVIPLFFTTYLGMTLVFGGSAQIAWHSYNEPEARQNNTHQVHFQWWPGSLALLISGICMMSVALVYSIVVCIIVPMMKKRRRRSAERQLEPESASVEGIVHTWYAHDTSDQETQAELLDSSLTTQLR